MLVLLEHVSGTTNYPQKNKIALRTREKRQNFDFFKDSFVFYYTKDEQTEDEIRV